MLELSLHIIDIVENSVRADADEIFIQIEEDTEKDYLSIHIKDNGKGMDEQLLKDSSDPFTTTKKNKKVGLGLSLLKEAAVGCGGDMVIESNPGKGTELRADFIRSHIDRQPIGDIVKTIIILVTGYPQVDFFFSHRRDDKSIQWETSRINKHLGDVIRSNPKVINFVKNDLREMYKKF